MIGGFRDDRRDGIVVTSSVAIMIVVIGGRDDRHGGYQRRDDRRGELEDRGRGGFQSAMIAEVTSSEAAHENGLTFCLREVTVCMTG